MDYIFVFVCGSIRSGRLDTMLSQVCFTGVRSDTVRGLRVKPAEVCQPGGACPVIGRRVR